MCYINDMKKADKKVQKEIVLGIIKNKTGKVIIINRIWPEKSSDGGAILQWAFPGGNIDEGETLEEAVVREVRNETGFRVKVKKRISERINPQFPVSIKYFECEIIPGGVRPVVDVHEIESLKWVSPQELTDYFTTDLDPGVEKFLKI